MLRLAVLSLWIAAILFVHLRSRVRLPWKRVVLDHTLVTAPYNALIYLLEGRGTRRGPFFDPDAVRPELRVLRDNWRTIRDEAVAAHERGLIRASDTREDLAFNTFFRRGWTRFYMKWYGNFLPSAEVACPRTCELLRSLPSVHAALFTVLPPGGRLGKHRDPFAGSLRYHLGLATPNDDACWIEVDGERYSWRDGEATLFDETFVHRARNDTGTRRIILFCDVERPIRNPLLRRFNRFLSRRVVRITQSRNAPDEPIGLVNRVSGPVFRATKRLQQAGDRAPVPYAVARAAVVAGLVWLLFFS